MGFAKPGELPRAGYHPDPPVSSDSDHAVVSGVALSGLGIFLAQSLLGVFDPRSLFTLLPRHAKVR